MRTRNVALLAAAFAFSGMSYADTPPSRTQRAPTTETHERPAHSDQAEGDRADLRADRMQSRARQHARDNARFQKRLERQVESLPAPAAE